MATSSSISAAGVVVLVTVMCAIVPASLRNTAGIAEDKPRNEIDDDSKDTLPKIVYSENVVVEDIDSNHIVLIVDASGDLMLNCTYDKDVSWNYPKKMNDHPYPTQIELIGSYISISDASFADTGSYTCYDSSSPELNSSVYIYVKDENHLLAYEKDREVSIEAPYSSVIVPCRPTSPNVTVALMKNDNEVTTSTTDSDPFRFDPRVGFVVAELKKNLELGDYACVATYDGVPDATQTTTFTVIDQPKAEIRNVSEVREYSTTATASCYVFSFRPVKRIDWIIEYNTDSVDQLKGTKPIWDESEDATRSDVTFLVKERCRIMCSSENSNLASQEITKLKEGDRTSIYSTENDDGREDSSDSITAKHNNDRNDDNSYDTNSTEQGHDDITTTSDTDDTSTTSTMTYTIIVGAVLAIVAIVVAVALTKVFKKTRTSPYSSYCTSTCRRPRRRHGIQAESRGPADEVLQLLEKSDVENLKESVAINEQAECLRYDDRFEVPRLVLFELPLGARLGSGTFGTVRQVDIRPKQNRPATTAVVKSINLTEYSVFSVKAALSELKVMTHVGKHVNVVNLLGACTTNLHTNELHVIVEYCRHGNLHDFLNDHRHRFMPDIDHLGKEAQSDEMKNILRTLSGKWLREPAENLSTRHLLCWGYQIARGMEFLASRNVVHGCLALKKVLLADEKVVKISDFGYTSAVHAHNSRRRNKSRTTTVKWMALESIRTKTFTKSSDVWSYGVVLWEMFSLAKEPYEDIYERNLYQKLDSGYRMEMPPYSDKIVYDIMLRCWRTLPYQRPSFGRIVKMFDNILDSNIRKHYDDLNCPYEEETNRHARSENRGAVLDQPAYPKRLQTNKSFTKMIDENELETSF